MDSETFILLSSALSFGAPMALAVRELLVLRRDRGRDGGGGSWRRDPAPDKPPPPAPAPAGNKPLPDCLVPKPVPRPAARPRRVLEDA
jgi:hypothetical protein